MLNLNMSTLEHLEQGPLLQAAEEEKELIEINMDEIVDKKNGSLMIKDPESKLIDLLTIIFHCNLL